MRQFGLSIYFLAESDQKQKFDSVRVPLRPYGTSRVSLGCWLLRLMVKILVNLRLNFIFYPH